MTAAGWIKGITQEHVLQIIRASVTVEHGIVLVLHDPGSAAKKALACLAIGNATTFALTCAEAARAFGADSPVAHRWLGESPVVGMTKVLVVVGDETARLTLDFRREVGTVDISVEPDGRDRFGGGLNRAQKPKRPMQEVFAHIANESDVGAELSRMLYGPGGPAIKPSSIEVMMREIAKRSPYTAGRCEHCREPEGGGHQLNCPWLALRRDLGVTGDPVPR
jgi:hypothetical protein